MRLYFVIASIAFTIYVIVAVMSLAENSHKYTWSEYRQRRLKMEENKDSLSPKGRQRYNDLVVAERREARIVMFGWLGLFVIPLLWLPALVVGIVYLIFKGVTTILSSLFAKPIEDPVPEDKHRAFD